jgi:magnesium transporter
VQLDDLVREANRAVETVRDVIQQVQQVVELSDSLKTQRLDGTIYALTVAATVLLVPTLMAGLWGMNFDYIPGAGLRLGFSLALLILVIMAVGAALAIRWYLNRSRRIRSAKSDKKLGDAHTHT